jgi:hypothetical protein
MHTCSRHMCHSDWCCKYSVCILMCPCHIIWYVRFSALGNGTLLLWSSEAANVTFHSFSIHWSLVHLSQCYCGCSSGKHHVLQSATEHSVAMWTHLTKAWVLSQGELNCTASNRVQWLVLFSLSTSSVSRSENIALKYFRYSVGGVLDLCSVWKWDRTSSARTLTVPVRCRIGQGFRTRQMKYSFVHVWMSLNVYEAVILQWRILIGHFDSNL